MSNRLIIQFFINLLLIPTVAKAQSNYEPFPLLKPEFAIESGNSITSKNIPPYKTQDGLGNCFSATAAAYLDMLNCKAQGKTQECSSLSDSEAFSRLATGKFAGIKKGETSTKDYSGLLPSEGANATNILNNIIGNQLCTPTQECSSLEKSLINFKDSAEYSNAKNELFNKIQDKFNNKNKGCADCLVSITGADAEEIKNLTTSIGVGSNVDVLKSLTNTTYSKFLEDILMPEKCKKKQTICYNGPEPVEIKLWPENILDNKKKQSTSIEQIKNILNKNTPVILNNICTKPSMNCEKNDPKLHTLIVTGYRKICNKQNECRDSLRVYNSYGATWQNEHNGGWIDGEHLLKSTGYIPGMLTWVEKETNEATASL